MTPERQQELRAACERWPNDVHTPAVVIEILDALDASESVIERFGHWLDLACGDGTIGFDIRKADIIKGWDAARAAGKDTP